MPQSISQLAQTLYRQQRETERERRYGPAPEQTQSRIAAPIEQWDDRKLMALLLILRTTSAMDCVEHLKAKKKIWPRQIDFADLRAEGFTFKRPLARFHELTPVGRRIAGEACRMVARRFRLCHVYEQPLSDRVTAKCTCGWSASFERKWGNENAQLQRAINGHLGHGS